MLKDTQIQQVIDKVISGFSGIDRDLRKDLEQELWLKVLENKEYQKIDEKFLYRILWCDARDWYRHTFKAGPVIIYNSDLADSVAEAKESTPTEADIEIEIEETVENRFRDLTSRETEIAKLLAYGYNQIEIAKKLGITKQRVATVIKQLQHKWRDD